MSNLDSAFWYDDFGFLIDRTHHPVAARADLKAFADSEIAERLEASGRLPVLGGAPVASWLLPRLVEITRGGIQLDDQEQICNDGGCVYLKWVAFTKTLDPRAFFSLISYPNRIKMHGNCMPNTEPAQLVSAFLAPLLEHADALRKWEVSVTDTDPPTAPGTLGGPYIFGWNGTKFLGTRPYP